MESRKFPSPPLKKSVLKGSFRKVGVLVSLSIILCSGCRLQGLSRGPAISITRRKQTNPDNPKSQKPPKEEWDHWVREFHELMSPEEIRIHLAILPQNRLRQRSTRLMDLKLRKHLLDQIRGKMTKKEISVFCALPTYKACQDMAKAIEKRKG
ncbi:MAG: hypothetical protein P1V97_25230 [Planctomycetota bacterium]|nr:hypothetical protein [Planctomycetota bacterium]